MIGYFIFGAFVGVVIGYVSSAIVTMSSTSNELENLQAYTESLEDKVDEQKERINQLHNVIRNLEGEK